MSLSAGMSSSSALFHARALGTLTASSNFGVWKWKVRAMMRGEDLLCVLDSAGGAAAAAGGGGGGSVKTQGDASSTQAGGQPIDVEKNSRVYSILVLCLDERLTQIVMHTRQVKERDGAAVWRALLAYFEHTTMASRFHTRAMLHKTRMHGFDEDFDVFVSRVQALASRLRSSGESVSEGELIYVVLEGLTEEYKALKASLEVQDNLGLEAICAHVRAAQEKLRYAEQAEAERATLQDAVFTAGERRRKGARGAASGSNASYGPTADSICHLCGKRGHWAESCKMRRGTGRACFRCGQSGHNMYDPACSEQARRARELQDDSAMAAYGDEEELDYFC